MQAADAKLEQTFHLIYPPFFSKLSSSSNPMHQNLTQFGLEIRSAFSSCITLYTGLCAVSVTLNRREKLESNLNGNLML
jgi:hypothetical protein